MLTALEEAHSKEWTTLHELLRVLIYEVNLLRLSFLAANGVAKHDLPAPLVIPSPKDPPPKRLSLRETARQAIAALGR